LSSQWQLCPKAFDRRNLERAWRWIRSNPDANYKRFCNLQYSRFAVADDLIIDYIRDRLRRGIYEPSHSSKFLIPKASGILRPYTILTVEDQIVYQALANVIAERLASRIRNRYFVQTFGHLYAGKTSTWFYRKWSDGYTAFNAAARTAFKRGLRFSASFDLTACYDSLDHDVLCYFLRILRCDQEFCSFLTNCLSAWTATNRGIYHSHGIPQGPLASGLIAEVVLQHFDQHTSTRASLVYLRYVDDIRLFATNETALRRSLIRLDQLSKDVGLFPQASKIDIHEVRDIEEELKSISNPTESAVRKTKVDQTKIVKRIIELTPRLTPVVQIKKETRFKFLLAYAEPTFKLNSRLLTIAKGRPDLTPTVMRYFQRYSLLPRSVAKELLFRINARELYDFVTAELIDTMRDRLKPPELSQLTRSLKAKWQLRGHGPRLTAVIGGQLIRTGGLSLRQTEYALRSIRDWWVRTQLIGELSIMHYGTLALRTLLNKLVRDANGDISLAAAERIAMLNVTVDRPFRDINPVGGKALRQFGVLPRAAGRSCGIEWSLARLVGRASSVHWRAVFGADYRQAEKQAVQMRALADTNVTAFVNVF
jgi:hypothetical protein